MNHHPDRQTYLPHSPPPPSSSIQPLYTSIQQMRIPHFSPCGESESDFCVIFLYRPSINFNSSPLFLFSLQRKWPDLPGPSLPCPADLPLRTSENPNSELDVRGAAPLTSFPIRTSSRLVWCRERKRRRADLSPTSPRRYETPACLPLFKSKSLTYLNWVKVRLFVELIIY